MKSPKFIAILATLFLCRLAPRQSDAQSVVTGYTSSSFDFSTGIMTGVVTTELDYSAQDYYQARVSGSIMADASSTTLTSTSGSDTDRDGTVSLTMQAPGSYGDGYTVRGHHSAVADIQDYSIGTGYYIDRWNFTQVAANSEGLYYWVYQPFYGFGPSRSVRNRSILVGTTFAFVDQVKFNRACVLGSCGEFNVFNQTTINLRNTQGGSSYCSGGATNSFWIDIEFQLPKDAADVYHDSRTYVVAGPEYEFDYSRWEYSNVDTSKTPISGHILVQAYRKGDLTGTSIKRVDVRVAGPIKGRDSESFDTTAKVTLNCD
jgi:hypothetical protein